MPRDEVFERHAAVDHIKHLLALLRKGQDIDADADERYSLRDWLQAVQHEIDRAMLSDRRRW
jgi:hypothetical protein